jgi:hypothetical protein
MSGSVRRSKKNYMRALLPFSNAVLFSVTYGAALFALFLINVREFKRSPEKGKRYAALPLGYKLVCWLFVVPLFAGTIIEGFLFIPALVSFTLLEAACVRWYRKSGLL